MERHEFLTHLHRLVRPRNYLEIGVQKGKSLALSHVPSIGVDPEFVINRALRCDLHLVRSTSDDFFTHRDPIRHLRSGRNPLRNLARGRPMFDHYRGGTRLDLAFVDGMHLFEFALRDFMNVERFADWWSVIVFDDVLPRNVDEAARERHTTDWTGDVYKLIPTLARHRPELLAIQVDTQPTGLLVILGADPANHVLRDYYEAIVAEAGLDDPQPVPSWVLNRDAAVSPEALIASPLWADLVGGRRWRRGRDAGRRQLQARLEAIGLSPALPVAIDA
ncbi:MAG: class I SAM-dependent methyltransferase [Chloroflexota bacterium]|nr:MAG: class I SAM-dependent methyltransferase [Chloroflexota bacterium]